MCDAIVWERGRVLVEDLIHETEEDGDDEGGLECLTEDDEVDGEREEIGGHDTGGFSRMGPLSDNFHVRYPIDLFRT